MAPQVPARKRSIASPQGTPVALPSPLLCRLSRPRGASLRLAASRSGGLPRRGACRGVSEGGPPAEGLKSALPGGRRKKGFCSSYPS